MKVLEFNESNSSIVEGDLETGNEYRSVLARATLALLDPTSDDGAQNFAVGDLYTLFSGLAGIDGLTEVPEEITDTRLDQGLALSPRNAARCIFHNLRTARFLQSMKAAIIEAQQRFPSQTIHVLYAGCGPYATLAVPLTTQFTSEQVQFTLLDIHQRSLSAAGKIVNELGISDYFRDFIECDAASYQHRGGPIHIVVTETMQKALQSEPQVAITLNLTPQLCEGGILIPESISLDVCIADVENGIALIPPDLTYRDGSEPGPIIDLGKVFEITATTVPPSRTSLPDDSRQEFVFPRVRLRIPERISGNRKLVIMTRIGIFQSIVLAAGDGWLNLPTPIFALGDIEEGTEIEFFYSLGRYPELKHRFV